MSKIAYSAVVLDDKSHDLLVRTFQDVIPEDYKIYCHHMTINLGEIKPEYEKYLGATVQLKVKSVGIGDKVIAVGVEGFPTVNKIPHITVAVDVNNGGKPVMSNNITNWKPIQFGFELSGKVTEVQR